MSVMLEKFACRRLSRDGWVHSRSGASQITWHSDDGVLDVPSEIRLSCLLHLDQDHGGDLLSLENLLALFEFNLDAGLAVLADDLEGEHLDVTLHLFVREPAFLEKKRGV